MRRFFSSTDTILHILVLLLTVFGCLAVFSSTYFPDLTPSQDFWQHLLFIAVGASLYVFLSVQKRFNPEDSRVIWLSYLVTLAGLLLVLFLPSSGPKRWISLGGFTIQPSEFAKLAIVLTTAKIWSRPESWKFALGRIKISINSLTRSLIILFPVLVLIWRQPSLGNTLLVLGVFGWMWVGNWQKPTRRLLEILFMAAVFTIIIYVSAQNVQYGIILSAALTLSSFLAYRLRKISSSLLVLILIAVGVAFSGNIAWNNLLTDYQRDRITAFSAETADPLGAQWQVRQAQIAIASGLIPGKGFLQGTQINYGLLPYAYTDFAYAAVTEQFGLVGASIILILISLLIMRLIYISQTTATDFGKLVAIGVAGILFFNTLVHVGMNLGIMPVTGVPLPFISYGGSSLLLNFIALGIVQSQIKQGENVSKLVLNSRYWG